MNKEKTIKQTSTSNLKQAKKDNLLKNTSEYQIKLTDNTIKKLKEYKIEDYINDIENIGLKTTWDYICQYILEYGENNEFLNIKNFGEMYEIGLDIQNKQLKKNSGKYYTPDDVALIMSQWFDEQNGENICDVACGTGKLILTYLEYIGISKAKKILKQGKLYLYDSDEIALKICKTSLLVKYGIHLEKKIHDISDDFLDKKIVLPPNSKTISNPPYASIDKISDNWNKTSVLNDTKELYSVFMEKIIKQSVSAVLITPFSFISGTKFYSLRKELNNYSGSIFSFDNVPGNIFCGRKYGIFNTNTSNSVRAAITIIQSNKEKGYYLTPLIRFKNIERKELLKCDVLQKMLSLKKQTITEENKMFYKCDNRLQNIYDKWIEISKGHTLKELIGDSGKYIISMPNTCRYYTTASSKKMNRNGQITLYIDDEKIFNYVFCLINSSFTYWFWRLYDGGITYPNGLLMQLPVFPHRLTKQDDKFFKDIANEMINNSEKYKITKNNIGIQENIKFPRKYRDLINERILKILEIQDVDYKIFDIIHSNMALEVNV